MSAGESLWRAFPEDQLLWVAGRIFFLQKAELQTSPSLEGDGLEDGALAVAGECRISCCKAGGVLQGRAIWQIVWLRCYVWSSWRLQSFGPTKHGINSCRQTTWLANNLAILGCQLTNFWGKFEAWAPLFCQWTLGSSSSPWTLGLGHGLGLLQALAVRFGEGKLTPKRKLQFWILHGANTNTNSSNDDSMLFQYDSSWYSWSTLDNSMVTQVDRL